MVLLAECISCGDSDVSITNKWEISELVNNTVKPRNILPSETRYGLSTPRFELLPNILTPGKYYVAILSAWKQGGLPGFTNYTFVAYQNKPPMNGNCTVTPDTGYALDTSFVLRCVDWEDQDPPLVYTFTYTLGKESTIIYSGEQSQRTFKLPIAEGADNSTINITTEIQDVLGMSAQTFQTVLVSTIECKYGLLHLLLFLRTLKKKHICFFFCFFLLRPIRRTVKIIMSPYYLLI